VKLFVDRLSETPASFEFEGTGEWWKDQTAKGFGEELRVTTPFIFSLKAHAAGTEVILEGSMCGSIEAECSRCIARYRQPVREPFRLVLEPARDRVPVDPEGVETIARDGLVLADDLEVGWYQGSEIRLDSYFAEVISLALPIQPLCREDCAGLCPVCGGNRNSTPCSCEEGRSHSPFSVLETLRGGRSEGDL